MITNAVRYLWYKIDEPRVHRFLVMIRYGLAIGLGISVLLATRRFEQTPHGLFLLTVTGYSFIFGGILGASNAWTRRWLWERPGTMLAMLGSIIGVGIELYSLTLPGKITGVNWILLVLFLMHLVSMIDRYVEIVQDDYEIPSKEISDAADEAMSRLDRY